MQEPGMTQLPPQERQEPQEPCLGPGHQPPLPAALTQGWWRDQSTVSDTVPPTPGLSAPTVPESLILRVSEKASQREGSRGSSRCCIHTRSLLLSQMPVYLG